MKPLSFFIALFLLAGHGLAAKLEVSSFNLNEDDPIALHQKRFDVNNRNRVCALIKLKMPVADFKVKGDPAITANIAQDDGTYFLYVSPTTVTFTFEATGYEKLTWQTPSFLQSARTYEMEVVVGDSSESKGGIYVRCNPAAEIYLNDAPEGTTPRFLTGLTTGTYKLRLSADGYRDYNDSKVVVEADKTTDVVVTLTPLSGQPAGMQPSSKVTNATRVKKERRPHDNGWFGGISLGVAFPSNYPANFYNGSPENENSFYRAIRAYTNAESGYYQEIKEAIGQHDFDTTTTESFSKNMAYSAAANFGIYGGFIFKKMNRILVSVDYHHLKTNGALILYYDTETPGNKPGDYYYDKGSVHGTENRFHINVLYSREFRGGEYTNWYLMGGFNMSNTIVKENYVTIPYADNSPLPPLRYNIKYAPRDKTGNVYDYNYVQGGIGFGATAGIGLRLLFTNTFSIDPELQFFYSNVHLNGYQAFKPAWQLNIRINLFTGWGGKKEKDF